MTAPCRPPAAEPLRGRVCIVTGGGSGIGRATVAKLVRRGAQVVVAGRTPSRVTEAVAEADRVASGGAAVGFVVDVRSASELAAMASWTIERYGSIEVLICCAGILRPARAAPR